MNLRNALPFFRDRRAKTGPFSCFAAPQFTIVLIVMARLFASSAAAQPVLSVSDAFAVIAPGDTRDLGEVAAGEPAGFVFTVRNFGDEPLLFDSQSNVVASIATGGVDEPVSVDVTELAADLAVDIIEAGGFAVLTVAFVPQSAGQAAVTVQVLSNDPVNPTYAFDLTVTATAPLMVVTDGLNTIEYGEVLNLGAAEVGDVRGKPVTIRNIGDANLVFDAEAAVTLGEVIGGIADFESDVVGSPIAPSGLGIVTTSFTIAEPGDVSVEIILATNDSQHPAFRFFVEVQVEGGEELPPPEPVIQIVRQEDAIDAGATVDIGEVTLGLVVQEVFSIANNGAGVLTFDNPLVDIVAQDDGPGDDFSVDVGMDQVLPGESTTMVVIFAPSTTGSRLVDVIVQSDDPVTPEFSFSIHAKVVESTPPPGNDNGSDPNGVNNENTNDNGDGNQPTANESGTLGNRSMCGAGLVSLGPLLLIPLFLRPRLKTRTARMKRAMTQA